jgi:hypothetical protein
VYRIGVAVLDALTAIMIKINARFRALIRRVLRSHIPLLVFVSTIIFLSLVARDSLNSLLIATEVLTIAAAFTLGYAARMKKDFPVLSEFRRSQYAAVWDELSLS